MMMFSLMHPERVGGMILAHTLPSGRSQTLETRLRRFRADGIKSYYGSVLRTLLSMGYRKSGFGRYLMERFEVYEVGQRSPGTAV